MKEPEIIFEKRKKTAYLTFNRPDKNNAFNLPLREKLRDAWNEISEDSGICSVIVTGGEKVFSTGQDLAELAEYKKKDPLRELPLNDLETFGMKVEKPVIAAISGYCLGFGFLLTMIAADIRIASPDARFGLPEVKVGVPPSLGIPAIVARHFPSAMAMELFMLGENMDADRAHQMGFINRVVPPEDLIEVAESIAEKINAFSPIIVQDMKRVFKEITAPDPRAIAFSNAVCMLGRKSEDYIEGPKAFREKRKPKWKGR
ncbi:enoyl-CoA hydratase/isomerase family protein [Thermodesulfobacteriota bacterium]